MSGTSPTHRPVVVDSGRARHRLALGAASLLIACSASSDERIAQIERDAKERIAAAQRAADRKVAEAEQQLATVKADLERKKAELERTLRAESSSFETDRKAFEQQCRATFDRLDREARALATKTNAGVHATTAGLAEQRNAVERDLAELGVATRESYANVKQRINEDLASFERSIEAARKKPRGDEPRH
jgi:hypothetical protein